MKFVLTLGFASMFLCAGAQPNKAYKMLGDFAIGNADTIPGLQIKRKYVEKDYSSNSRLFVPYTGDKAVDKGLDTAAMVEVNDSLYLNCRSFRKKEGKVRGFISVDYIDGLLYYRAEGKEDNSEGVVIASGIAFGLIGALVASGISSNADRLPDNFYLCLHPDTGLIEWVSPEYMLSLLEPYPDLKESYEGEQEPKRCSTVGEYLRKYKERSAGAEQSGNGGGEASGRSPR